MVRITLLRLFPVGLFLLLIPTRSFAQGETTSAISGLVTDETGSGIPGADITAVSEENGQKRSLKTDEAGRFAFPQLPHSTVIRVAAIVPFTAVPWGTSLMSKNWNLKVPV